MPRAMDSFQSSCPEVLFIMQSLKCASKWAGYVLSAEGKTFGNGLSSETQADIAQSEAVTASPQCPVRQHRGWKTSAWPLRLGIDKSTRVAFIKMFIVTSR